MLMFRPLTCTPVFRGLLMPVAVVVFSLLLFCPFVSAEDASGTGENEWSFALVPYLWCLSLDGSVSMLGNEMDVSVGFDKMLQNLNLAAMMEIEVTRGRFGLIVDPLWAQLTGGPPNIKVKFQMFIMDFGLTYRLGPFTLGSAARERGTPAVTVEPYIGGRYSYLDTGIDFTNYPLPGVGNNVQWADPLFGFRSRWDLSRRWNILIGADVGGFGVGSQLAWSARALVGYHFNYCKKVAGNVMLGYRALYQDYNKLSGALFEFDATMHGPVIGLSFEL